MISLAAAASAPACPACGGAAAYRRAFDRSGGEAAGLWRCRACLSEFLHPQPSDARLARAYAGYAGRQGTPGGGRKIPYFLRLLAALGLPAPPSSVMDLGAAEGDALAAARRLWPEARLAGIEPGAEARPGAGIEIRPLTVEAWLDEAGGERFDLVLAFDLLEHLRDPADVLARLARDRMAPGGVLAATFPNGRSLSRRLMGPFWMQWRVEHFHYLSRGGVEALARAAGLETVRLATHRKKLPLAYLLSIGSGFGPPLLRRAAAAARKVVPPLLAERSVTLPLGEWAWTARREAP